MFNFLNKVGLKHLGIRLDKIFGRKAILDRCIEARNQQLLNIDYEKELAFNTSIIIEQSY